MAVTLEQAIIAYYGMSDPLMSDTEFDRRFADEYPDGPTPFEVYKRLFSEDGRERDLVAPMLSLAKVFNHAEVARWAGRMRSEGAVTVVFSPKYDGLPAQVLFEEDGSVVQAVTRGDGRRGQDVTYAVSHIPDLHALRTSTSAVTLANGRILAAGEVCLRRDQFTSASAAMETEYSRLRNAAVGILRSTGKNVSKGAAHLTIRPHWGGPQSASLPIHVVDDWTEAITEFHTMFRAQETTDGVLDDGVVLHAVDVNGKVLSHLGDNGATPRYAVAYKFPQEPEETVLVDVIWQRNRTRYAPVAVFDPPAIIDESEVSKASLHNPDIIESLGIAIGDTVLVELANGTIPQVVGIKEKGADRKPIPAPPVHDGADMFSTAKHILTILDVRGRGPVMTEAVTLLAESQPNAGSDPLPVSVLHALSAAVADPTLLTEQGVNVGAANAEKFARYTDEAMRSASPAHWLAMAGAEGVGRRMSAHLLTEYHTLARIRSELDSGAPLVAEGFGPSRNEALHRVKGTVFAVLDFADALDPTINTRDARPPKTAGGSVVITGGFEGVTRSAAAETLAEAGFSLASSVSKNITALIVAGADPKPSSKTEKAAKLGVRVIHAVTVDDALSELQAL